MAKKQKKSSSKKQTVRASAASPKTLAKPPSKPRGKSKTPASAHDPLDDFIRATAHTLALPVDPSWQPAVKTNLEVILRQAALFTEFSLPDDTEPAPVFEA
jgi:hypothetical protein